MEEIPLASTCQVELAAVSCRAETSRRCRLVSTALSRRLALACEGIADAKVSMGTLPALLATGDLPCRRRMVAGKPGGRRLSV